MIEVVARKDASALAERIRAACMVIRAEPFTDKTDRLVLAILDGEENVEDRSS